MGVQSNVTLIINCTLIMNWYLILLIFWKIWPKIIRNKECASKISFNITSYLDNLLIVSKNNFRKKGLIKSQKRCRYSATENLNLFWIGRLEAWESWTYFMSCKQRFQASTQEIVKKSRYSSKFNLLIWCSHLIQHHLKL